MDNLTHSLIGLIAGESIARATPARAQGLPPDIRRGLFVTLAVIGGNLPDLDLIYSYRGSSQSTQSKLEYLLQHRGYTHTVIGCLVLAFLLYAAVAGWARWRRVALTTHDRYCLAGMSVLATMLHVGMDFLNSYGVHPFWPWQNRWFYGDSVFIVEPLYWVAMAPLLFVVRSLPARIFLGLVLAAGLALCLFSQRVLPAWSAGYAVLVIALLWVGARTSARTASLTSAAAGLLVTVVFVVAGGVAGHRLDTIAASEFPGDRLVDRVLSPAPMNPFCWDALLLQTHGDRYAVRHGALSTLPAVLPAERCPKMSEERPTTSAVEVAGSAEMHWLGEFGMSRELLAQLVASHCDVAALMQFARAPFAADLGAGWLAGDLRFDSSRKGAGISSIGLGAPTTGACRREVPWTPPREALLRVESPGVGSQGVVSQKQGDGNDRQER